LAKIYIFSSEFHSLRGVDFWTSGSDEGCSGKLRWCAINKPYANRNSSWNADGTGDCVSVKFQNHSTLSRQNCSKHLRFICEVSNFEIGKDSKNLHRFKAKNQGTFASALQNECMEIWNISDGTFEQHLELFVIGIHKSQPT
jgi:hypothetical protein